MPTHDGDTRYWPLHGDGPIQIEIAELETFPASDAAIKKFFEAGFHPAYKRGNAGAVIGAATRKEGT